MVFFFLLSSVESSRCAANWQTRVWKLKLISNKLVDLRNLYPNMVVFGLELLIFWSWFRIWTYWLFETLFSILYPLGDIWRSYSLFETIFSIWDPFHSTFETLLVIWDPFHYLTSFRRIRPPVAEPCRVLPEPRLKVCPAETYTVSSQLTIVASFSVRLLIALNMLSWVWPHFRREYAYTCSRLII